MKNNKYEYRIINSVREEGFDFFLSHKYVAYFFTNIMRAQVRIDGPETLMKWSRDWEYPWILMKSDISSGDKVLDCGSGYSPVPFIWSSYGADVHAIDRDIQIISKFRYALGCICTIYKDLLKLIKKKAKRNTINNENIRGAISSSSKPFFIKLINYFKIILGRIWKSDFWGPIPPKMIKKYGVDYMKGDFTNLSFDDNSFDVVSCVSVLEHMTHNDQIKGIKEMARVVKEGGKLIITYDNHIDLTEKFIDRSGMEPSELVYFKKPENLYDNNFPDVIGMCLIKK
jgi:SAM-dependent methyltransferase